MPEPDEFDTVDAEAVGAPGEYLAESLRGVSLWCDIYNASVWGCGKSVAVAEAVRRIRAEDTRASVIYVSCRKSLSSAAAKELGAVSYQDVKHYTPEAYPVAVYQVEALRAVADAAPTLLVLDEFGGLLEHCHSNAASNVAALAGLTIVRNLIRRARVVHLLDNDATAAHVEAVRRERPEGQPFRVVRSLAAPWAGTPVELVEGPGKAPRAHVAARLFEYVEAQNVERLAGRSWRGAVVPCHSVKVARAIARRLLDTYGPELVRFYEGGSDDHTKARDFADASKAWANVLAVVYSPCVSVGVSCSTEHIGAAFAFFRTGHSSASTSAQMVARCRKLRAVVIAIETDKVPAGLPTTRAELLDWATLASNRDAIPAGFRDDRSPLAPTGTTTEPKKLGEVLDCFEGRGFVSSTLNRFRSARWFTERLAKLFAAASMEVTRTTVGRIGEAAAVLDSLTEAGADAAADRFDALASALPAGLDKLEAARASGADIADDFRPRTALEKAERSAAFIADSFHVGDEVRELCPEARAEWLAFYEPFRPAYAAAERLITGAAYAFHGRQDVSPYAITSRQEATALARVAFEALGLDPANVEPIELPADALDRDAVANAVAHINRSAPRVLGDRHAGRRASGLSRNPTPGRRSQLHASTLAAALAVVGAGLEKRETGRRRHVWRLSFVWYDGPAPHPRHPARLTAGPLPAPGAVVSASEAAALLEDFEPTAAPTAAPAPAPRA